MRSVWDTPLGQARIQELRAQSQRVARERQQAAYRGAHQRMYATARQSRLTGDWTGSDTSADAELSTSLRVLRGRSRALVRDAAYAKRARNIIVNNVIGTGIGLQAKVENTRRALNKSLNAAIEAAWDRWVRADSCHTGGTLHFADLERVVMAQVFEAGEVFLRIHRRAFGASGIPLALELIEAERIAEDYETPQASRSGAVVRMGIELDTFYRPQAVYVRPRHPSEFRWTRESVRDQVLRVPAEDILHVRLVTRWPQTRGEPWLHAVARKLNDMDGYSEAEIVAARGAANYLGVTETEDASGQGDELSEDGRYMMDLEPGTNIKLAPGEKFNFVAPNRPNTALDPFMRYMLREVAAGADVSYESLSRDYSQSNYSSSRLALLDDRDCWRALQQWFIRTVREPLHRQWLQAAVLAQAIPGLSAQQYALNAERFESVRFKPRGWSWVDPTKEVAAYKDAVRSGFKTVGAVIAETGGGQDIEDVMTERREELDMMEALDLSFESSPEAYAKDAGEAPPEPPPPKEEPGTEPEDDQAGPRKRAFSLVRPT